MIVRFSLALILSLSLLCAAQNSPETRVKKKTSPKYVLASLVLPGSGEYLMGNKNLGKFFLGTELLMWGGYFATKNYTNIIESDFQSYAAAHAGVNTGGKDDQFWIDVGNSDNLYAFNEKRRVERRLDDTYVESEGNFWQWDSKVNRDRYNDMRFKHHDWKEKVNIVVGGMVLNRLLSGIDVIRLLKKNKRVSEQRFSRLYISQSHLPWQKEAMQLNLRIDW